MLTRSNIVSAARLHHGAARNAAVSVVTGVTLDPESYNQACAKIAQADRLLRRLNDRKAEYNPSAPKTVPVEFGGQGRDVNGAEPNPNAEVCICTRMYETGRSGDNLVDLWVDSLNWPHDWYRNLYHGRVVEEVADQFHQRQRWYKDSAGAWQSEMVTELLAKSVKYRIEQRCPAHTHYSGAMLDEQLGKDVYTSLDPEKDIENREADEASREVYDENQSGFARIRKTEYRGDDADVTEGGSDVLNRQRRPDVSLDDFNHLHGQDNSNVQTSFLPFEETQGAKDAPKPRTGVSDPFRMQYHINSKRIESRNKQARRDLWAMILKMDEDSRKLYTAYVQDQVAQGKAFIRILPAVRRSVRASLVHLKEVA